MKQNLRKILAMLVLSVFVLGLVACGSTNSAESGPEYDAQQLQNVADYLISNLNSMDEEEIAQIAAMDADDMEALIAYSQIPFTAEAFTTAFAGYAGSMEELGAYVSTESYDEPIVKGDEITLNVNLKYEKRPAQLSLIFNEDGIVETITINPEYTIIEILQKALMNTILGMGTVFVVLIFISLVIYCFNFIPAIQEKFSKKKKDEISNASPAPATIKPVVTAAPETVTEELVDDGELVAAITAAICAYSGTSSDGFVVRSIRRAESATWKKA